MEHKTITTIPRPYIAANVLMIIANIWLASGMVCGKPFCLFIAIIAIAAALFFYLADDLLERDKERKRQCQTRQ